MKVFSIIKNWLASEIKPDFTPSIRYAEMCEANRLAGLDPFSSSDISSSAVLNVFWFCS